MSDPRTFAIVLLIGIIIGIVIGLVIAKKIGIGDTNIENNIGKIKRNDGTVNVEQKQPEIKPKKPFFKRIFTRKNRSK